MTLTTSPPSPSLPTLTSAMLPPAARDDGLFRPDDLDPITWQLLVHEGALRVIAPSVAIPVRRRPTPDDRARPFVGVLPAGWALGGATAAWVHVGGAAGPSALSLTGPPNTHQPPELPGRVLHQQEMPDRDLVTVAGVPVTSPLRTAVDVACFTAPSSAVPRLVALAQHGVDLDTALHRLAGLGRQRGVVRADRSLRAARARC